MRILLATPLYPPEIGGPATYAHELTSGLSEHNIEVVLVPFSEVRHLPKVIRHIVYLGKLLRQGKGVDVIYALDPVSVGLPSAFASIITRKKLILRVPGDYAWEQGVQRFGIKDRLDVFVKKEAPHIAVQILRGIEYFVAKRADRVVVPSKYMQKILGHWGVPKEKTTVIYTSASGNPSVGNRRTIRGLLKFQGKIIISVGRLVPWKGFGTLIKVFAEIHKKHKDTKLFIVGTGPDGEVLERLAEKEGVGEDVIFAGRLEHDVLMRYLAVSDLFVLNTQYEGFSHTILEALAAGLPVVTTRAGGNTEIITDGENGILVTYNNQKQLTKSIETLLTNRARARALASEGVASARLYSTKRSVRETAELLKSL